MLRILLLIDSLHCGGAQRQICTLAIGLKELGHTVQVAIYYPKYDYFRNLLERHSIEVIEIRRGSTLGFARQLRLIAVQKQVDWVIAFLNGPVTYALLSKLLAFGRFKVCVGERSANVDGKFSWRENFERSLYRFADFIVANSSFQSELLKKKYSKLEKKIFCIPNCIEDAFFHDSRGGSAAINGDQMQLLVVGQINPLKNLHGLIDAIYFYKVQYGSPPLIRWAGRVAEGHGIYFRQQLARIEAFGLNGCFAFLGEVSDIPQFLRQGDALIHPSLLEGFPNAVCESMASALPVLVGDVADGAKLVGSNQRGFLFDVSNPVSIASAIRKFVELKGEDKLQLGQNGHSYAEQNFRILHIARQYSDLLSSL